MKKAMKKLMAALLAVAMVCAMAIPAWAAEGATAGATTGTITVDNAVNDKTYSFYRIMDIATHTDDSPYTGVVYKVNHKWSAFVRDSKWSNYFTVNTDGTVTVANDTVDDSVFAETFAAEAQKVLSSHAADYTVTASDGKAVVTADLGYYLVVSDGWDGTKAVICSLGTTTPNVTIKEKNGKPTIEKEVKENSTGKFGEENDASIGDIVEFKATVKVIDGAPVNYVVHDVMSNGLRFVNNGEHSVVVKVNDSVLSADNYTVNTTRDDCTFDIVFKNINDKTSVLKSNDLVTITYYAEVTADAVIADTGNENKIKLKYGDNQDTEWEYTKTYVWSFDVYKYTSVESATSAGTFTDTALPGAIFKVLNSDGSKTAYFTYDSEKNAYKFAGWSASEGAVAEVTTPDDGKINFVGLDSGSYKLEEVEAPQGYNALTAPIEFTISNTSSNPKGQVSYKINNKEATGTIKVLNNAGTTLPGTGGIGTTIFYVVGGGLMAAAAILLITKKRMENH